MSQSPEEKPVAGNLAIIEEFRARSGRVGGMFEGAPLVLLTTTGARTGRPHTTPVTYRRDGARLLVFATFGGSQRHPDWYHNLVVDRRVTVEIGTDEGGIDTYPALAVVLDGEERDQHYREQAADVAAFEAYQASTTRVIPVIALHRADFSDPQRNRGVAHLLVQAHQDLREELATLRAAVARYEDGDRHGVPVPSLGAQLRRHCLSFCEALGAHHGGEDRAFPLMAQQFPHLAPALERLQAEHHHVARNLEQLRDMVEQLPGGGVSTGITAELDRITGELEEHFRYEEAQLLPALDPADPGPPSHAVPIG